MWKASRVRMVLLLLDSALVKVTLLLVAWG